MKKCTLLIVLFLTSIFAQAQIESVNVGVTNHISDNSGYDVTKYKLEFYSDPQSKEFSGKTTIHFKVINALDQIILDADDNLNINQITYNKKPVISYIHEDEKLKINLPATLILNSTDSISVSFSGNADQSIGYNVSSFKNEDQKEHWAVCTSSVLMGTPKSWWVCKDGLTDKTDEIEFHITHPSSYKAVANGILLSKTDNPDGTTTTIWKNQYPIPPYLIALAVAEYEEYHQTMQIGETEMPVLNYIYPGKNKEDYKLIHKSLDKVPSYIVSFSELFGEYPFKNEKYGQAEWFLGGAMENSTITFMDHRWTDRIIIHELAHQWFGDQITCATWNDVWLNEGFATYLEALMYERQGQQDEYQGWFNSRLGAILDNEQGEQGSVYNPEPDNPQRTFSVIHSYYKGGMVVHQLRSLLGDEPFFQAIRTFLNDNQFNFVSTDDLKQSLMNNTGKDLTEFFNDWIYGEGYPIFDLTVTQNTVDDVHLKVDQTQTHSSVSFFETPFKVEFIGKKGQSVTKEFDLTHNHQSFHINDLPFKVKNVIFNPDSDLIAKGRKIAVNNKVK